MVRRGFAGYLFLFIVLILSSCHPRHVSGIRPNMTKDEVVRDPIPGHIITRPPTIRIIIHIILLTTILIAVTGGNLNPVRKVIG